MAKVYVFLADGFEDIEALAPIDILRRGGQDVTTVSINATEKVESAHGVTILADTTLAAAGDMADADLLLLPGGMPGAQHLKDSPEVGRLLLSHESQLEGATYTAELVTEDGNITTGEGPAAAMPYGYKLLSYYASADVVEALKEGMRFNHLMA